MRKIFKYHLNLEGYTTIKGKIVRLLDAQKQWDALTIWAIVDDDADEVEIEFCSIGTGFPIKGEDEWQYFRTVQIGEFVYHVFITDGTANINPEGYTYKIPKYIETDIDKVWNVNEIFGTIFGYGKS